MKKIAYLVVTLLSLFVLNIKGSANAHYYRNKGDLQVELHVLPDDSPKTLELAKLKFTLKKGDQELDFKTCDCSVLVDLNGSQKLSTIVKSSYLESSGVAYIPFRFPQVGIYTIGITGKPKSGSNFESFDFKYNFRVDKMTSNKVLIYKNELIILAFISFASLVILLVNTARLLKKKLSKK